MTVYQMPLMEIQALPGLKQVELRLRQLSRGSDSWTPLFSDAIMQGGKRLRPALVLLGGSFYPASQTELVDVGAAAELIHAASLVHDDVIDNASLRRSRPTVSAEWGENRAVLYGDFLFARAFSLLTRHGLNGILENMTRAISLMCEGEIEQAALLYNCNMTEADYLSYIHKKTAFFISACCLAGADVSGMPQSQQRALAAFGLQLGYAFQLTDDLLDLTGHAEHTGKPVMQDLKEGVLTLPVLKLLQDPCHGKRVKTIIEEKDFSQANLQFIQKTLNDLGMITETRQKARALVSRAKFNLEKLPLRPPRAILSRLADYVVRRSF